MMKLIRNPWVAICLAAVLGASISITGTVYAKRSSQPTLPVEDIRNIAQVLEHVKRAYVEEIDDKTLLENAIRGMLTGLDPHSAYLSLNDYSELRESTSGKFGGLGIEVSMEDGFVKVVTPIDDTPADRAGIEPGDLIVKLDATPVKGLSLGEAVEIMRGEPGTTIVLTVVREDQVAPFEVTIERDVIKVTSVRFRALEPGYGYIRISQFQERTGDDFKKAIKTLREDSQGQLKGLVLDLRNNPGGVLQAAVEVVDAMMGKALVVYTQGRLADSERHYYASDNDISEQVPLVVLINGGSASASEIVAGAIQDHKRGVIMGTRSFGKGSVQTIMQLSETAALKLTTARYFTPSGRSIQALGIVPDVVVERATLTTVEKGVGFKESDLPGRLNNPKLQKQAAEEAAADTQTEQAERTLAQSDYQLFEALTLLKGMAILAQR